MKTTAVYVLTSNSEDYYLEQLMVSAYSLRLNNPDIEITLVVDQETFKSLTGKRSGIQEYVSDIIPAYVPLEYNNKQKSRFLKTNLRKIIEGDYLFIDTDTVISGNLSELDSLECSIAASLDKHVKIKDHLCRKSIIKYAKLFDWSIPSEDNYFNSGIMYVKDDSIAHNVYESWHKYWKSGLKEHNISIDQPSLAKANYVNNYPIKELPGVYNCQIVENGLKFLSDAKIIHYFASNIGRYDCPYLFRDPRIYETIKKKGMIDEIKELLNNPKAAFLSKCMVLGGNQCDIYVTPLAGIARRVSLKFPSINSILGKFFID